MSIIADLAPVVAPAHVSCPDVPTEGSRVRLLADDAFLRQYTSGHQGATGTVLAHEQGVNPRGAYVVFDGDTEFDSVWVGFDELSPVVGVAEIPSMNLELPITMEDLCRADLRRHCPAVMDVAATTMVS